MTADEMVTLGSALEALADISVELGRDGTDPPDIEVTMVRECLQALAAGMVP